MSIDSQVDEYILSHISEEPEHLSRLYRRTHLNHLYPRMCSGHLQGRILAMLTAMIKPKRVLELGTYTGYSALCLAENLADGGEVHTIEIDDEMEEELTELFSCSPGGDKVKLHIGDAEALIPTIDEQWDMIYIDANKRHYIEYIDLSLPRLVPGGFIIADNTLWDGKVTDTVANHDAQTVALDKFNSYILTKPELEVVILPVRDGLTLIRKKK